MKIRGITLDDDELPASVLVEMTRDEAALVCHLVGSISPADLEANFKLRGWRWKEAMHSVYDGLAGGLFNRFWDGGVRDAINEESQ